MADLVRADVPVDIEARLANIDAAVRELLDLWKERSDGRDRLGRELVEERARNLELQRRFAPAEDALLSAQDQLSNLERALEAANRRADEALLSAQDQVADLERALEAANRRADEAQHDLASARERSTELERKAADQIPERAQTRIAALEAQLADISGDLAEREHLVEELQQALRYERDLRKLRETERDRLRELFGYLQKSRWRRFGQAIGVVKTREWERLAEGEQ